MGAIVTIMNMKGGVGKTTLSTNLGLALGVYDLGGKRRRVLLIDYDPQFNLSQTYIPAKKYFELEKKRRTSLAILRDDETNIDPFVLQVPATNVPPKVADLAHTVWHWPKLKSGVDIIPSTLDLMFVAVGEPTKRIDTIEQRFATFIDECRGLYDVVVIDCHPAGSVLTKTSLRNSDHVLIPVAPEPFAVRGIGLMKKFIEASRVGNAGPAAHVLFNRVPRTGTAPEESAIRADPNFGIYCLANTLKKYKAFAEPHGGTGFIPWSGKPYAAQARQNLVAVAVEVVTRLKL